ncbi:hypothetical protein [Escherichia coli]|uniref:hypothetical protein n=1 Tax=Escherichia coli TaxID=562 RepID=UPI00391806E0
MAERVRADADTEFNSVAFRSIGCPDQPVPDRPVRNIPHRQGTTFTGDGVVLKLLPGVGKQPVHLINVGRVG